MKWIVELDWTDSLAEFMPIWVNVELGVYVNLNQNVNLTFISPCFNFVNEINRDKVAYSRTRECLHAVQVCVCNLFWVRHVISN